MEIETLEITDGTVEALLAEKPTFELVEAYTKALKRLKEQTDEYQDDYAYGESFRKLNKLAQELSVEVEECLKYRHSKKDQQAFAEVLTTVSNCLESPANIENLTTLDAMTKKLPKQATRVLPILMAILGTLFIIAGLTLMAAAIANIILSGGTSTASMLPMIAVALVPIVLGALIIHKRNITVDPLGGLGDWPESHAVGNVDHKFKMFQKEQHDVLKIEHPLNVDLLNLQGKKK